MQPTGEVRRPGVLLAPAGDLLGQVLRLALEDSGQVDVLGVVAPVRALSEASLRRPDVVVVTLTSRDPSELALVEAIRSTVSGARVLVLSKDTDADMLVSVVGRGATGCVSMDADVAEFVHAVLTVAHDEVALSGRGLADVVDHLSRSGRQARRRPDEQGLSERELLVLHCLGRAATTAEIAAALGCSPATARAHIQGLLSKLGVHSRLEAAAYAEAQDLG